MKKSSISSLILALMLFTWTPQVYAETLRLEISGNGSTSENVIKTEQTRETQVEQANQADVSNEVAVAANTGGNQANNNTGNQTQITTGDINTKTTVQNDLNTSTLQTGCCPQQQTEMIIKDNGAGTTNSINASTNTATKVTVSQEATVDNQIQITANTGKNEASGNSGDVTIQTGDIKGRINLSNVANQSMINAQSGSTAFAALITRNGSGSTNTITINQQQSTIIDKHEEANIRNRIQLDANTGENSADNNLGDVFIYTGSIDIAVDIINGPINRNLISVGGCCPDDDSNNDPGDPIIPPPSNGGNPSNPESSGGNVSGSSNGSSNQKAKADILGIGDAILPATGGDWLLLILANVIMFLMGFYLRLRSGRSPGRALATART